VLGSFEQRQPDDLALAGAEHEAVRTDQEAELPRIGVSNPSFVRAARIDDLRRRDAHLKDVTYCPLPGSQMK